ncbi:hypothetical protein HG530_011214 [Fusarium avenaceum]|nr:hypothetical protein HG530_011214 [Fusarium avenaceum]
MAIPSSQGDSLRCFESVTLVKLLPALDGTGLNTEHVLPAILGRKVLDAGRLIDPRVPDNNLVEVVADNAETWASGLGDDNGVPGTLGRGVDGVGLGGKVSVKKSLEVERGITVVGDNNGGVETFRVKRHTVDKGKLVWPESLEVFADAFRREAEVELDAGAGALAGGLSEELPSRVAGETVLGELGYGFVIGSSTEDLQSYEISESDHGGAMEENLYALAGGKNGLDAGVVVGDVDVLSTLVLFIVRCKHGSIRVFTTVAAQASTSMLDMGLLINLFHGNEKLSVVIVSSGFDLSLLDNIERTLETVSNLLEDSVHLLQRSICCLGEEEVNRRHHDGVYNGKDDIGVRSNVLECWRGYHNNQPVEDPVARRRQSVSRSTDSKRCDLGRVQPSHSKPANSEKGVEDEEEDNAHNLARPSVARTNTGKNSH